MNLALLQRAVGIFFMGFSATMLPPAGIALLFGDGALQPFLYTFMVTLLTGFLFWFPRRQERRELRTREGFLVITLFWVLLCGLASMPFHLAAEMQLSFTDAVFEAVSGLTTTGATVLVGIDHLPHALLWYRQQLQWLGGLAVAVIALAVLPVLGVGGMQLYRGEAIGPSRHEHLLPRLKQTTRTFLVIYAVLTLICATAYWLVGMSTFDAVAHALSTLSTGGFSTHDSNIAYFQSDAIEMVCMLFMIVGGISFALHYRVMRDLDLREYFKHSETRIFLVILATLALVASLYLVSQNRQADTGDVVMNALFQVVAVLTTSGFRTESFADWPGFMPVLLIFMSIMGACAGSTTGGMKTARFILVYKQGMREVALLIHPNSVAPVKLGNRVVAGSLMEAVWGFFAVYTLTYVFLLLLFMASGMDQVTAFSAVAATLNNLGPGLGEVAQTFSSVTDFGKWVGIAAMLLGRLEIFVLLVLLTPEFWRH